MSITPFRIINHIKVIAKPLLIFIFAITMVVGYAQKPSETKPGEAYNQAIKDGDRLLQSGDYLHALNEYEKALNLSPSQKYPQEKIAEIQKTLADSQLSNTQFETAITNGAKFLAAKDYKNAKREYLNALRLDPEAQYPKDRLTEISKVYSDPEDEARYSGAVKNADVAFGKAAYDEAIGFYKQALAIKPGEKLLKTRIADAERLKAELLAKRDIYNKSIAAADKLFEQKKLTEAHAEYVKALSIIPGENYPAGKIAAIDQVLAAGKASDDAYAAIVDEADKLYVARDFNNARIRYQQALSMRPSERYPKSMLEKADMGQTEVRTIRQRFDDAITSADNLFKANEMDAALIGYQSASMILPDESYPKTKIAEIKKIASDRNSRQDAYRIAIANGDQAFDAATYTRALAEYKNALSLQPTEDYPKTRIAAIEALLLKEKESQDSYNKAIAIADKDLAAKKYPEALAGYQAALGIKPAEKYPQDKITEINTILDKQRSVQENYDKAIADADIALGGKNYPLALTTYQSALGFKPSETYPKGKITEINTLLAQQKTLQDNYDKAITAANKAFGEKNYTPALTGYQSALVLKPAETYPQEKISEINEILSRQKSLQENYDNAILAADKDFDSKKYNEALSGYQAALVLKPAEKYPQGKISEINGMLGRQKTIRENYDKAIASADKSLGEKNYSEALASYKSALTIMPSETYPQGKITEINGILGELKTIEDSYNKAIAAADKDFVLKKYPEAITGYQSALAVKPSEKYPQDKITEINNILDKQRSVQENYDKAITDADKAFGEKNYSLSLTAYQSALGFKPAETYPKGKITEINTLLEQQKTLQDNYDKAITAADKAFGEKNYTPALTGYQSALGLKPSETYPQEKITEINGILAEQKALQENYDKALVAADIDFAAKKYPEALTGYQSALGLKPAEKYPQGKINEINGMLGRQKALQESYDKAIAAGDKDFGEKKYTEAISGYKSALAIKPAETYPQGKISEINIILEKLKAIQDSYEKAIASADMDFATKNYPVALSGYQSALSIKPEESYPPQKISEINGILGQQKTLQENYEKTIASADKSFGERKYSTALNDYQSALRIKPTETYPKGKIEEINTILAKQKEIQDNYDKAIAAADKDFGTQKYPEATTGYKTALAIKPSETYPQQKITEINGIIAQQKTLQENYDKAIAAADKAFGEKNYSVALTVYQSALGFKSTETYPQGKITEINGILGQQKALQENYDKAIAAADKSFAGKDYPLALTGYQSALGIIPGGKYPNDKIAEINVILAQLKSIQESYDKAIAAADKNLGAKNYPVALTGYQSASALKPSETYPQEKITEINLILSQQKALQENYEKAIASADKALLEKNYSDALANYQSASGMKPSETYPQGKINDINLILGKQKAVQDSYDKTIVSADKAFDDKKFAEATSGYKAALSIKPGETYPQEKLNTIDALLAQQKELDDNYGKAIAAADKALLMKDYPLALSGYQAASGLKPGEAYPQGKITEINTILGKQKALQDSYEKAITDADKSFVEKDFAKADLGYKAALLIKPMETYPQDKITEIASLLAKQKSLNESYSKAITAADKAFGDKDYSLAISGYQSALGFKPDETYPKEKISAINAIFAEDKEKTDQRYAELINKADADYAKQNYTDARISYQQASTMKPAESYPKDKLTEISNLLLARTKEMKDAYDKIIIDADRAYAARIFDQAIDFYANAHTAKPDEAYPGEMIAKIQKYMADHSMVSLTKETFLVLMGTEKRFSFKPIAAGLRKNNYVVIKARNPGTSKPKVYLNYGRDAAKNGGIVLRSITSDINNDFIIRISIQDKWYREDNNWLSLYSEGGDIEVSSVQIAQGD